MSSNTPQPRRQLLSLPPEILDLIAQAYISDLDLELRPNILSVLTTSSLFHSLFLPKLYSAITVYSLDQLARFVSPTSGAHRYCPQYTTESIVINIPGVPGGSDAVGMQRSRDRLLLASQALALCPKVESVSFEFFSIRHSESFTSDEFRNTEAQTFEQAVKALSRLKRFRWVPPRCDTNAIMGLSIVIVDQVIAPLARGLTGCENLETLELWNTMLPPTGGADLAESLIAIARSRPHSHCPINLNLRSVTGLDPKTVSDLALSTPPVRVNIADGFVGSIWGARIDKLAVQECMRQTLDPTGQNSNSGASTPESSQDSSVATSRATTPELLFQDTIAKACDNVTIKVLSNGIAGSRMMAR